MISSMKIYCTPGVTVALTWCGALLTHIEARQGDRGGGRVLLEVDLIARADVWPPGLGVQMGPCDYRVIDDGVRIHTRTKVNRRHNI